MDFNSILSHFWEEATCLPQTPSRRQTWRFVRCRAFCFANRPPKVFLKFGFVGFGSFFAGVTFSRRPVLASPHPGSQESDGSAMDISWRLISLCDSSGAVALHLFFIVSTIKNQLRNPQLPSLPHASFYSAWSIASLYFRQSYARCRKLIDI